MKKQYEQALWGGVGVLAIVGGASLIVPSQVASIVAIGFGGITVLVAAGVSAVLAGIMILAKQFGKG